MTMPHQDHQDQRELLRIQRDEQTVHGGVSCSTLQLPRGPARRWSVAQLVAAAQVAGEHPSGA